MLITGVETFLVEGTKYNWCFVRVETDAGITGWGEGTNWPGSPLIEAACQHVGERLIGEDARRIDYLWTKIYRDLNWLGQAGPVMSAISAIDIALWDIKGKALGAPIFQLLGGAYQTSIPLYANYWFTRGDHSPRSYAEQALQAVEAGMTALKMDPFAHVNYLYGDDLSTDLSLTAEQADRAVEIVRAVQAAVGPSIPIAIETHAMLNGATAVAMAQRLAETELNCMWYEEPAPPEMPDAIAAIAARIPFPVAVGERLHSRYMFRPVLERQAAHVLMPDVTRCGGISEMRKIASMAEAFNVPIAPHNPNGPISTIAAAHVMASIPNALRLEFIFQDVAWRDEALLPTGLPVVAGRLELTERPGLGFDLDPVVLARHPGVRTAREDFYV